MRRYLHILLICISLDKDKEDKWHIVFFFHIPQKHLCIIYAVPYRAQCSWRLGNMEFRETSNDRDPLQVLYQSRVNIWCLMNAHWLAFQSYLKVCPYSD